MFFFQCLSCRLMNEWIRIFIVTYTESVSAFCECRFLPCLFLSEILTPQTHIYLRCKLDIRKPDRVDILVISDKSYPVPSYAHKQGSLSNPTRCRCCTACRAGTRAWSPRPPTRRPPAPHTLLPRSTARMGSPPRSL